MITFEVWNCETIHGTYVVQTVAKVIGHVEARDAAHADEILQTIRADHPSAYLELFLRD